MEDFTFEFDKKYLLTPQTERGRAWLDNKATAADQFWGKSLIVSRRILDEIQASGLTVFSK